MAVKKCTERVVGRDERGKHIVIYTTGVPSFSLVTRAIHATPSRVVRLAQFRNALQRTPCSSAACAGAPDMQQRGAASIDALTSADAIVGACADDARCRGTLATWLCTQPPEMDVPSIRDRPTALRRVASGHSRPVHPNDRKCRRRDGCQFATQRTRVGSDRIGSNRRRC